MNPDGNKGVGAIRDTAAGFGMLSVQNSLGEVFPTASRQWSFSLSAIERFLKD
jgi:hypothetical protein